MKMDKGKLSVVDFGKPHDRFDVQSRALNDAFRELT